MDDKDNKGGTDFLYELCEQTGVTVSTVKDGTVFMFKRSFLESMLASHADQEKFVIFVKRPGFEN